MDTSAEEKKPVKGYRGEPWSTDGKFLYDRNGEPFARMYEGCAEFAQTIVTCVNLLTNLPIRDSDRSQQTELQKHALAILENEARLVGDDPR